MWDLREYWTGLSGKRYPIYKSRKKKRIVDMGDYYKTEDV